MRSAAINPKIIDMLSARKIRSICCICGRSHKFEYRWARNDIGEFILKFFERELELKNEFGHSPLCGYCTLSIRWTLFTGKNARIPDYEQDAPNDYQAKNIEFLLIEWMAKKMSILTKKQHKSYES